MSNVSQVMIIEDNEDVVETITLALQIRWPDAKIVSTDRGVDALELIEKEPPDIVILDLGLPDVSGFEVLKNIRLFSNVPVVVLTVRKEEADVIKGLELGADDYITKPFRQLELVSRINAVLRRETSVGINSPLICGSLRLDLEARVIHLNERRIKLTSIEAKILTALMENPGRTVTYGSLADRVWGLAYQDVSECLKVHVRSLREKLESDPSHPNLILTTHGAGYRLMKPV